MKVAILGYGREGRAAYEYWDKDGNQITVCDLDSSLSVPRSVVAKLGKDYLMGLGDFDLVVRSPGIHPNDIVKTNPGTHDLLDRVTSVTNEFFRVCPTRNIIGVTGTKGKGTTSTLIAQMLEAAGKTVHLGGNIGIPPLSLLKNNIKPDDLVVLELSSFQLIDLKYSPHIAVCVMVTEEHLNWHADMDEYLKAKKMMFSYQTQDDIAVYYGSNDLSKTIASAGAGKKIPYMINPGTYISESKIVIDDHLICSTRDVKLLGPHNLQNICAAVTAVWQITQDIPSINAVIKTFAGLEHRLELIKELDQVKYYDDSFGTTPDTAIVAIAAFDQPKVVILGGSDKKASYEKLADTIKNNTVRSVVLIGATAPAIEAALMEAGYTSIVRGGDTMQQIVQTAREQAIAGDVVLLSTGCASFGLFKNYKDRGEQFKTAVQSLVSTE